MMIRSPYRKAYEAGAELAFAKFATNANQTAEVTPGNPAVPDEKSVSAPFNFINDLATPTLKGVLSPIYDFIRELGTPTLKNALGSSSSDGQQSENALQSTPAPAVAIAPPASPGSNPASEPQQDFYRISKGDTNYNRIARKLNEQGISNLTGRQLAQYLGSRNLRVGDAIDLGHLRGIAAPENPVYSGGNVYTTRDGNLMAVNRGALPPRRPAPVVQAPAPAPAPVARAQSTITPRAPSYPEPVDYDDPDEGDLYTAPGSRGSQLLNQLGLNRPRTMADRLEMGLAQEGYRVPQQRTRSQLPIGRPGTPRAQLPEFLRHSFGQSIIDGLSAVAPRNPDIIPGGF
jgi:hypothetical protein